MANSERVQGFIVLLERLKAGEPIETEMFDQWGPIKTIAESVSTSIAGAINHAVMGGDWDRAISECQKLLGYPLDRE